MKFDKSTYLLYAVTQHPSGGIPELERQVEQALAAGATLLQLREKDLDEDSFLREALRIRAVTERCRVPLIINDNIHVALECGADGVHIGQDDIPAAKARALIGPHRLLGVTAKTVEQAVKAERDGADYLGSGALFPSPTKKNAVPMSVSTLTSICSSVSIPVTAIGGITCANVGALAGTGIAGAAIVSGIFSQPDIPAAVRTLRARLLEIVS